MKRFRKIQAIFTAVVLLLMVPIATAQASTPVQDARNGVVRVAVIEEQTGDLLGWGAGFFIGEAGKPVEYLITNAHVAGMYYANGDDYFYKEDPSIYCIAVIDTLYNSESTMNCQVVKVFDDVDLAILKLNAPTTTRSALTLKSAENVGVTDTVYAMGFPWSAEIGETGDVLVSSIDHITVTKGSVTRESSTLENDQYIQIDTSINQGNSGGPLVTEDGCVVGIVTSGAIDAQNTNFALYIDYAMEFLDQSGIAYDKSDGTQAPAAEPEASASVQEEPQAVPEEPVQAPVEEPAATSQEAVAPPDAPSDGSQASQGGSNLLLIIGAVALVALLGGGIFLLTSKKKKPATDGSTVDGPEKYTPPEGIWTCPHCGQNNDARFCAKCGREKPRPAYWTSEAESRTTDTETGTFVSGDTTKGRMKTSPNMHADESVKGSGSGAVADEHYKKPTLKTRIEVDSGAKSSTTPAVAPHMKSTIRSEASSSVGGEITVAPEKTAEPAGRLKSTVSAPKAAPSDSEADSYFKRPKDL